MGKNRRKGGGKELKQIGGLDERQTDLDTDRSRFPSAVSPRRSARAVEFGAALRAANRLWFRLR